VVGRIASSGFETPSRGRWEHAASVRPRGRRDEAPKGPACNPEVQFD